MGSIPLTEPRVLGRFPHRREPCGHREAPGNRNTDPARTPASRKVLGPLTVAWPQAPHPDKSAGQRFPQPRSAGPSSASPRMAGTTRPRAPRPTNTQKKPERKPTARGTSAPGQGARVPQITRVIPGPDRTAPRDPRPLPRPEKAHLWLGQSDTSHAFPSQVSRLSFPRAGGQTYLAHHSPGNSHQRQATPKGRVGRSPHCPKEGLQYPECPGRELHYP